MGKENDKELEGVVQLLLKRPGLEGWARGSRHVCSGDAC